MIKTSVIFSAHAIHVLLRNTLIFLVVLFLAFFIWLMAGIKLDTVKAADYYVEGLYIKLDKKLIVKADHVILPQSKANPSFNSVHDTFERIKYLLTFFQSIELKHIVFNNNVLSIEFSNDFLKLSSKDYEITGTARREGKMLKATIPLLFLKKHNVTMSGKLTYDLHEKILATEGFFRLYDVLGRFNASKDGKKIDFGLESDSFSDLKRIIDMFDLEESVRSWVVDKVKADHYKLLSLTGKGTLEDGTFKMDFDALKGEVLFSDTQIHFKEALPPVLAPSFVLAYHEGGLYFDLKDPTYEGISLQGSKVSILNLLNADTNLKLKIRSDHRFDATMQHLLKAYDIVLPVDQQSGKANVLFMADLALKNSYQDYFVNVDFNKSDVLLGKVKLPIQKGNVQYKKGLISFNNIYLKGIFYEGKLDGTLDLQKKKSDFIFDAKRVTLGDEQETFFSLNKETLPFTLNYAKNIQIKIPKFSLKLTNDTNETSIQLNDLNKIKPYLPDPGPIENGGKVTIQTKDFTTYTFKGNLKRESCFLYEKNDQCKTRVPFEGTVTSEGLDFYAFDKRFHYNKANARIKLTNLNFDLEKFLTLEAKKAAGEKRKKKDKVKAAKSLIILGENSQLRYGKHSLVTDSYDVEIKPNGDIKAIGSSSGDIIKFSKEKDIFSIQALRIQDKALHPLIDFQGLQNGRYTLKFSGDPEKTMKGEIIIEGGVMKDFKAYNNTLAFINTIPALASLQSPGYSDKGFTIEKGIAEYRMIEQNKIIFDSIYIKGVSATIAGTGEIDLEKKTIDLNLAIQSARELGKLVGSLPLVGYIIMGEDKSMTFGLQIIGRLDDPQVKTSAGGDILSLPLKILKRALESPEHIINE
ncbi:AsmA-like C-terminal domain-containing protein [Sulfurovum sp. XGS-02]|uniref:YhdP family protein n=1 Tax=Sulfurovum sp. XGS-02 TaxID=2925411 RepID=UPI0020499BCE|nr:AsmA-like C-terminal domain-containing protein [Sulfurovum sp. XGS-02]UPT76899.1 AsmA-like C-terminal domain-containing protein [Sulfurovum sp. XGS-02]